MSGKAKAEKSKGLIEIIETRPDGTALSHKFGEDPFLVYLKTEDARIRKMEEMPLPGPHCESWYGEPCQFLAGDCPLSAIVPETVDDVVPADPVTKEQGVTNTLRQIADNPDFVMTPELASWALAGTLQLSGFLKRVEKRIEAYSKKIGPVTVGETQYGWFTKKENVVNKEFALQEMLRAKMTIPEVCKVISISKSSIDKKIPKATYPALRSALLAMAVSEKDSNPKFGVIKDTGEEEEA